MKRRGSSKIFDTLVPHLRDSLNFPLNAAILLIAQSENLANLCIEREYGEC
jgi:hypothetical protein